MPRLIINNLSGGLNKVFPPHLIANKQLSECNNVVYRRGKWTKRPGYTLPFSTPSLGTAVLEILDYLTSDNVLYTLVCTDRAIYTLSGTSWVTQKDFGANNPTTNKYFSTEIRNNLFITNGINAVQQAVAINQTTGNSFSDVAWDTSVDPDGNAGRFINKAAVVLAFNSRLLLFNTDDNIDGAVPVRMMWSEVFDFDRVEVNNFNDLDFDNSPIIHARKLGNGMIAVYKPTAVVLVQDTGSPLFFLPRFTHNVGLIAPKAVTDIPQGNFFVSQEGFFLFVGGGVQPVGDDTVVSYFFEQLNESQVNHIYCFTDKRNREVIILYPAGSSVEPNKALIYNWQYDTWSEMDFSAYCGFFQYRQTNPPRILFGSSGNAVKLFGGTTDNGAAINSKIHTKAFANEPSRENMDPSVTVEVVEVLTDASPSTSTIKIGSGDTGAAPPTFSTATVDTTVGRAPLADVSPIWGWYITLGAENFDSITEFNTEWRQSGGR